MLALDERDMPALADERAGQLCDDREGADCAGHGGVVLLAVATHTGAGSWALFAAIVRRPRAIGQDGDVLQPRR